MKQIFIKNLKSNEFSTDLSFTFLERGRSPHATANSIESLANRGCFLFFDGVPGGFHERPRQKHQPHTQPQRNLTIQL